MPHFHHKLSRGINNAYEHHLLQAAFADAGMLMRIFPLHLCKLQQWVEQWHDRWVTPFFTINPGAFRVGDERTVQGAFACS